MSNAKAVAPKIQTLNFGKKPSMFSGGKNLGPGKGTVKSFVPPTFRVTQHKGGGGK